MAVFGRIKVVLDVYIDFKTLYDQKQPIEKLYLALLGHIKLLAFFQNLFPTQKSKPFL